MIPKVIHYCWFGRKPLPRSAKKCIKSWKRFFPDFEIKEWNEDNFDIDIIPYTRDAYNAKKYAFVSDYARMWILYNYGGIYFDTDVEIIKPMHNILNTGAFMGCEINGGNGNIAVNPGLGVAIAPGNEVYSEILRVYSTLSFKRENGDINTYAIVNITTDTLKKYGLKDIAGLQQIQDISVYPAEYFNPMDSITGRVRITSNSCSIHHYMNSWASPIDRARNCIGKFLRRIKLWEHI